MGTRVMLVFQPKGGAADGVAHPDKAIPSGTVIVRAAGEGGEPLPGIDIVLGHARAGERAVQEHKGKTDAQGEAKFTGLDAKPESGYLAEAIKDGQRFAGKPFKLKENMGSRVTIDVRPVSKDVSQLHIGPGSHFIFEVADDVVQVAEVWRLMNPSATAIDPGPNGLHLPLAEHALSAQGGPAEPAERDGGRARGRRQRADRRPATPRSRWCSRSPTTPARSTSSSTRRSPSTTSPW